MDLMLNGASDLLTKDMQKIKEQNAFLALLFTAEVHLQVSLSLVREPIVEWCSISA